MEIKEILDNLTGRDDEGNSKAQIGCYLYEYNLNNPDKYKEIGSSITDIPSIALYPNGNIMQVDLTFLSEADTDFYKMNELLNRKLLLDSENADKGYLIIFNVLPANLDRGDTGYFEMFNPIFSGITALAPKQPALTLRMLYNADDIVFYESDFDSTNVSLEADYEVRKREDTYFQADRKKHKSEEQAAYLDELRKKYRS